MKKYNVIVILDKDMKNTLMCKRTKEPYMGMYNLVGGKIEKDNDGINEAYRELVEETNILNKEVKLIEEVNKLEWVSIEDNFFDMKKYAGEGNIGHIIEEIKIYLNSRK